jgi:deoxyribodipyrimidine photo-lyase
MLRRTARSGGGVCDAQAPHEDHLRFFADVDAAMVIGDENPMREPEQWRVRLRMRWQIPFWTVDADVVVPSKLLEKAQLCGGGAAAAVSRAAGVSGAV